MNRLEIFTTILICIMIAITGCKKGKGGCDIVSSNPVKVADTGQTLCSSGPEGNRTMVNCGNNTVTVTGQDGNYTDKPNARGFTGPTQHATYTDDYTTEDNVTKLIWKTCTEGMEYNGSNCIGSAALITWYEGIDICCELNEANNGAGYAGRTDWRMPSIHELMTIVDFGKSNPAIDETYFPDTHGAFIGDTPYKASNVFRNPKSSYVLYFNNGTALYFNKTDRSFVRCVSGP